uniref:AIG1-type G domain-containing protein n=1 Tax=Neogobius melanostomus TaxID=47308 RepID=A0A8C6TDS4_9GOBI
MIMVHFADGKESEKTLRIVLIGKTGNGKSSSGNSILGRAAFKSDFGQDATTKCCQKEHSIVNSCRVEVVDTPGLFDRSMSNQEIYEEMVKCISLLAPGPHVFLVVLGINRFTPEENETVNLIMTGFGKDAQKYIIVLFTMGKYKCDRSCKKLISDCGNRYHVFNNDDESKRQQQVNELIQKIDALVEENGGSCYTNKDLTEAEAAIQRKVETLLKEREEEFEREKQEMEDKHKQEMQEIQQRMEKEREETERVRREKDNERRQMEENLQQNFDLKSQEVRDKMEKERQEWEEERKNMRSNTKRIKIGGRGSRNN